MSRESFLHIPDFFVHIPNSKWQISGCWTLDYTRLKMLNLNWIGNKMSAFACHTYSHRISIHCNLFLCNNFFWHVQNLAPRLSNLDMRILGLFLTDKGNRRWIVIVSDDVRLLNFADHHSSTTIWLMLTKKTQKYIHQISIHSIDKKTPSTLIRMQTSIILKWKMYLISMIDCGENDFDKLTQSCTNHTEKEWLGQISISINFVWNSRCTKNHGWLKILQKFSKNE